MYDICQIHIIYMRHVYFTYNCFYVDKLWKENKYDLHFKNIERNIVL